MLKQIQRLTDIVGNECLRHARRDRLAAFSVPSTFKQDLTAWEIQPPTPARGTTWAGVLATLEALFSMGNEYVPIAAGPEHSLLQYVKDCHHEPWGTRPPARDLWQHRRRAPGTPYVRKTSRLSRSDISRYGTTFSNPFSGRSSEDLPTMI